MARMLVEACVRLRARRELAGLGVAGCRCARRVVGAWPQWQWRCRCGRWVRDLYWAGPAGMDGMTGTPLPLQACTEPAAEPVDGGQWACRHCHGLAYRSQRVQARRAARRARAAAARIWRASTGG
jgi:hypothetical protein